MTKYLNKYTSLLAVVTMLSCNGQQKTESPKVGTPPEQQAKVDTEEFDPYFSESETITSPYGPNGITRNIIQDKKGNIWLATWEGIIQYNGMTFTNFTNKEGLRRFRVFSLLEDSSGNIWFGTIGAGVYRYDGKSFTNFTAKDGLANDSIGCITEAENGVIWFGTLGGISKFDGVTFSSFPLKGGRNNNDVNAIVEDETGKLWIGTRGDACTFDGKTSTTLTSTKGQPFTNVRTIIKDKKGSIWLGGNNGFWSYDGTTFANHAINFTGYIYQDKQENIWTSSESEDNSRNWVLTKYDNSSPTKSKQIKNEENMFFGITEDKKGGIWLGTARGVYRYDGTTFNDFTPPKIPFK